MTNNPIRNFKLSLTRSWACQSLWKAWITWSCMPLAVNRIQWTQTYVVWQEKECTVWGCRQNHRSRHPMDPASLQEMVFQLPKKLVPPTGFEHVTFPLRRERSANWAKEAHVMNFCVLVYKFAERSQKHERWKEIIAVLKARVHLISASVIRAILGQSTL